VYNIGGGKQNSCSILEAFKLAEKFSGRPMKFVYVDGNRIGDHICYYSDLSKMREHYPGWDITVSLEETIRQIVEAWSRRSGVQSA
jgi:CDP-paratose 2-epimerase